MYTYPLGPAPASLRALGSVLLICVLVLAGGSPGAAAGQANVVSGTVRTADGRPLAGATIRVSGATGAARGTTVRTTSDRSGNYRVEVPPGDYDVDAFYDLAFDGQTYRELWLDRTNDGCGRQLSQAGIVRHFVLRLSGPLRCTANFDPNEPTSYAGGALHVTPGSLPPTAKVRFTLTPIGPLADGSKGRTLTFERTGTMLTRGGGRLGETGWLHDIPLGRYRVSADVTPSGGESRALVLRDNTGGAAATAIEISFPARKMYPYGMQSAAISIVDGPAEGQPGRDSGSTRREPPPVRLGESSGVSLPVGRYPCSHRSEYAGDIPNDRVIVILDGGRYQGWGASGTYVRERTGEVRFTSGPLAQRGVTVTFAESEGRAVLTVRGGAAADDRGGTNRCVRSGV